MTSEELERIVRAVNHGRPTTQPAPQKFRFVEWLPIIISAVIIGGGLAIMIFETKASAANEHLVTNEAIATEAATNLVQDEQIHGLSSYMERIDANVQRIAERLNVRGVERE